VQLIFDWVVTKKTPGEFRQPPQRLEWRRHPTRGAIAIWALVVDLLGVTSQECTASQTTYDLRRFCG
jgi:hypothetical protein